MTPDPQRQAFLDMIIAEPHEDVHRLVYADWIDERGESERAALIRVQCELEEWKSKPCSVKAGIWVRGMKSGGKMVYEWPKSPPARCCMPRREEWDMGLCLKCDAIGKLNIRERELLNDESLCLWDHFASWASNDYTMTLHGHQPAFRVSRKEGQRDIWCRISRGFLSIIQCTWPDWNAHADEITRQHPIEEVRLLTWPNDDLWTLHLHDDQHAYWLDRREEYKVSMGRDVPDDVLCQDLLKHTWPTVGKFILPEMEAAHA